MKKLVLIDGNAILHRAYHALPPLNNKDGKPTNAVYGFFTMLFKIIEDLKPEYLIVCFDREKPTFRKELYVGYQGSRPKLADDLSPQFGMVHKALDEAKINHCGIDGYEADDLIGTLSKEGAEKGLSVIIVSGDRDLLQLVNKNVLVLAPIIGMTKMILFDEAKIREKYGLEPSQFIDYKALVGDSSDNYPGVSGIGPKTASSLLEKYKTFEGLYEHISELPAPIKEKLANDAEQAALAKKLATIVTDAPIKLEEKEASLSNLDANALKKVFENLGFKSIQNKIPKAPAPFLEEKKKDDEEQLGLL
jgi:DNA polymerase-1